MIAAYSKPLQRIEQCADGACLTCHREIGRERRTARGGDCAGMAGSAAPLLAAVTATLAFWPPPTPPMLSVLNLCDIR